jgi:methionyl-tRNA synthetase
VVPGDRSETPLDAAGAEATAAYARAMDAFDLRGGADAIGSLVSQANLYIQQTAPWALAKQERRAELDAALAALARCLQRLAILASPFMPAKADALWAALGREGSAASAPWAAAERPEVVGTRVSKPEGLFPRPAAPTG